MRKISIIEHKDNFNSVKTMANSMDSSSIYRYRVSMICPKWKGYNCGDEWWIETECEDNCKKCPHVKKAKRRTKLYKANLVEKRARFTQLKIAYVKKYGKDFMEDRFICQSRWECAKFMCPHSHPHKHENHRIIRRDCEIGSSYWSGYDPVCMAAQCKGKVKKDKENKTLNAEEYFVYITSGQAPIFWYQGLRGYSAFLNYNYWHPEK